MNDQEILKALKLYGSARKAAAALNIPKSTFSDWVRKLRSQKLAEQKIIKPVVIKAPKKKGEVKRYIVSSAQNGTKVHPFFDALKVYAEYLGAEIMISGYTYNKALFEDHSKENANFALELGPYLTNERVVLGDKVIFAGELNILPTATNPIQGLTTYTGDKWGVYPHSRIHLESVPMMKDAPAKMVMTTGTVTKPNYVRKLAGNKAQFHHTYGAVLIELVDGGEFFCRHLMGEEATGAFYDLDRRITVEGVTTGHRVEAILWGDIHTSKLDRITSIASFGYDPLMKCNVVGSTSLVDSLRPKGQFFHDVLDFQYRNHHSISDPHFRFQMFARGTESVEEEIRDVCVFLSKTKRDWSTSFVIESNHDAALQKWIKTSDYRQDPVNAIFFLESQLALYKAMRDGDTSFNIFWDAVTRYSEDNAADLVFVPEDTSYKICGDIEMGMHGHLGANGARPSPKSFSRMGTKASTAHTHSASIYDGVWTAGVSGKLDMSYNKGLSSWSPTHIITYLNGKRAMFTMSPSGKFYAD